MDKQILTVLISVLTGAFLVILYFLINKIFEKIKRYLKIRHGLNGELKAKKFMEQNGYKVLEYQPEISYEILIDDESHIFKLKPDYIVSKNGKIFVAEVKTGDYAPSVFSKDTRRQLLEYYIASNYDGVILVNMEERIIQNIDFLIKNKIKNVDGVIFFVFGVLFFLGTLIIIFLRFVR